MAPGRRSPYHKRMSEDAPSYNEVVYRFVTRVLELRDQGFLTTERAAEELGRIAADNPSRASILAYMNQMVEDVWKVPDA
jgi:hypothetical protein